MRLARFYLVVFSVVVLASCGGFDFLNAEKSPADASSPAPIADVGDLPGDGTTPEDTTPDPVNNETDPGDGETDPGDGETDPGDARVLHADRGRSHDGRRDHRDLALEVEGHRDLVYQGVLPSHEGFGRDVIALCLPGIRNLG